MAEQIPYAIAEGLISNLASWAFGEIGRVLGVEADLEELKDTLELIQAVLSDAEERQHEDRAVKIWIRRLKDVVHHADNLFADLLMHGLRHKVSKDNTGGKVRGFFSSALVNFDVARQIKEITEKCNKVAEDMSRFNLNRTVVIQKKDELAWRETSSYVMQSEIIGREENKNDIMNLLNQTQTNQNVSLIAIVGMGGLGKTALAQVVFNDAAVQKHFQKKIWVCISEDFEVKSVLNRMLKSLRNVEVGQLELDQLQKMLQEELSGQRYLLVLDDVWNESQLKWNDLRNYLMCGGEGSKILVTSRSTMVSKIMGIESPYVLKGITKDQSWSLLKSLAFGDDTSKMSPTLESIGERIAEKCGGVPLAIRTVGGFLRTINEESDQWESFLNDDIWRLSEEKQSIMPVLKLSYQKLPLGLRQCFAYCYLYPKDWEISKNELIYSWMAQGYLETSSRTQSMEDVGNQYIRVLLMRSFFQEASMDEHGDIESFKMHDLMHDLAKSIAGNDCLLDSDGKGIAGRPMHVALLFNTICSLESLDASHLRTIICRKTDAMISPSLMKSLMFLRVLNLSHSSITQLPESVDNIKYLKCLNLSRCYQLVSLPKSIGNLVCLQTLDLAHCVELVFSLEIIVKLINLRHLDFFGCMAFERMMPVGFGKLTSLQRFSSFVLGGNETCKSGKLNELKELNNLTGEISISNLGLVNDVASESQETNLQAKKHIQGLCLAWGEEENKNSDSLELLDNLRPSQNLKRLALFNYPGVRFSGWLSSLASIVEIDLQGFSNCQHLPPLERLPCLKKLYISEMRELKCIYYEEVSNVFFPYLEKLDLDRCGNLRGWQRLGDDNAANNIDSHLSLPPFPCLYSFKMRDCPNLICKPTLSYHNSVKWIMEKYSLDSLSELQHIAIDRVEGRVEDVKALADEWMQGLTSLKQLSLKQVSITPPLLRQLQHLPSELQELHIELVFDDELDLWKGDNSTPCHGPPHALRSLQKFSIDCCGMKALPEHIGELQSLRHIDIVNCHELESLPEAMRCLTNLQTLSIRGCPLLHDRCQAEIGQDWPKIAHIPNLYLYEEDSSEVWYSDEPADQDDESTSSSSHSS